MGASISSGCSLPSRSVRSNRLVMAASRTLQGQGEGEETASQPHAGRETPTPSAQGEVQRLNSRPQRKQLAGLL